MNLKNKILSNMYLKYKILKYKNTTFLRSSQSWKFGTFSGYVQRDIQREILNIDLMNTILNEMIL